MKNDSIERQVQLEMKRLIDRGMINEGTLKKGLIGLGLAGAGYLAGKAAGPAVDRYLAQNPYEDSVSSATAPSSYGSPEFPAGGDEMPAPVADALMKFRNMPEFSDKTSLRAAIDSLGMAGKDITYEAVKAEYDSIVGESGASLREGKLTVSVKAVDRIINEELSRLKKK